MTNNIKHPQKKISLISGKCIIFFYGENFMNISIIILAAGHGKRMNSTLPKVLHLVAGKPMLEHVVEKACILSSKKPVVVYGYQGEMVQNTLKQHAIDWVPQNEQLGTGHAALQGVSIVPEHHHVLILYGDVPLISVASLKQFIRDTPENALGIITANFPDPTGIGRILRNEKNQITRVVEEKDANEWERQIKEVNTGFYFAPAYFLKRWLPKLNNQNAQKEYYLTDIIELAVQEAIPVYSMLLPDHRESLGINNPAQLAQAEIQFAE
jgi:bifunctional UDP-N-acetylglucosamine pyrophosphorylase/glucosamine-1-phosphate N-acetyltransferase